MASQGCSNCGGQHSSLSLTISAKFLATLADNATFILVCMTFSIWQNGACAQNETSDLKRSGSVDAGQGPPALWPHAHLSPEWPMLRSFAHLGVLSRPRRLGPRCPSDAQCALPAWVLGLAWRAPESYFLCERLLLWSKAGSGLPGRFELHHNQMAL